MKGKFLITIAAVVIIVVVLSAALYVNYTPAASTSDTAYSITDDEGYTTQFTATPQRIISLAPSNTQILFAIGVGDKVVGVTEYDSYPYNFSAWFEAGNMTDIGGFSTPNKETIASLNPDLILATTINDQDVTTLRSLGYKVIVLDPNSVTDVITDIVLVGQATGASENATSVATQIHTQITDIQTKIAAANVSKPLVYYEVWNDPLESAGGTSFINDIITQAGGINIFENETDQYPTVSSETIVQKNPNVIILPTNMGTDASPPFYGSVDQVKARPGWSSISAIQNNRIVIVNGDLFAEAGPRIGDAVAAAAAALYPELFNST